MISSYRLGWGLVVCGLLACLPEKSPAQLFGQRNLGAPLSRRMSPGAALPGAGQPGAGTVTGAERFVRENRNPLDFVGADRRTMRHFVGSQRPLQGRASPQGNLLRPQPAPHVNTPLATGGGGKSALYEPRLVIGFEPTPRPVHELEQTLAARLAASIALRQWGQIEVSVAGRTATLRGEVASADARRLAEALVRLEPGISDVQNDLRATSPPAAPRELPRGEP